MKTLTFGCAGSLVVTCWACGSGEVPDEILGHQSRDLTSDEARLESERDRIRNYFREKRENMNIVATTTTSVGQIIDWTVPTETELRAGEQLRALLATEQLEPLPPLPEGFVYARSPLESEPDARGPEGTVPNVRLDIEGLLRAWGDSVPADPEAIFSIMPTPNPDANRRYHVGKIANAPTLPFFTYYKGLRGRVGIWDAPEVVMGDTSIMQTFLGSSLDTIESGKSEWFGTNGGNPTFFIYFTNNKYVQPETAGLCDPDPAVNRSGGYVTTANKEQMGYASTVGTPWPPMLDISSLVNSVMLIQWTVSATPGYWNLFVNSQSGGQFQATCRQNLGPDGVAGTPDDVYLPMWHATNPSSTGGLQHGAAQAQWYGEVFDNAAVCSNRQCSATGTIHATAGACAIACTGAGATCLPVCTGATITDMGNGNNGSTNPAISAWIDQMQIKDFGGSWVTYNSLSTAQKGTIIEDTACYGGSGMTATNGFFLGGAGDQAPGCN